MRGTEALAPTAPLNVGVRTIGGHRLEFIAVPGHARSDMAVLIAPLACVAIDQVFNQRTPTLPNAILARWRRSLAQLAAVPFKLLVPGHGPGQPRRRADCRHPRLSGLAGRHPGRDAAERGLAPTEVVLLPIPSIAHWGEARAEWRRGVWFIYGRYERAALPWLSPQHVKSRSPNPPALWSGQAHGARVSSLAHHSPSSSRAMRATAGAMALSSTRRTQ